MPRRIGLRRVVAYPAVTVALVVSVALVLTPFGPSKVMALTPEMVPAATTTASPTPSSTSAPASPSPTSATSSTTSATPSPTANPSPSSGGAVTLGGTSVDHYVLARIEASTFQVNYLQNDVAVTDASRFQTFRVRAQLRNAGADSVTVTPQLEYRTAAGGGYTVVPEMPLKGIPFHVVREWVASLGLGGGTIQGPLGDDIAVGDFQIGNAGSLAVKGRHSMGANPDQRATLLSASYTEEEFTVTLSMDARYLTGYQLRITNGGTPLTGADVATMRGGGEPAVRLSPGQQRGVAVAAPKKATATRIAYPLVSAPQSSPAILSATGVSGATAVPAVYHPNTVAHPLVAAVLSAATYADTIHGPYDMTAAQCATCHRAHVAKGPNLMVKGSQSDLCFMCHDGSGATANVQAEYHPLVARPANDSTATTRDYYSHDAEAASNHTNSGLDEFAGVSNRHSSCADCHNSHKARALPDSTQTTDLAGKAAGRETSGRPAGVSGVAVPHGPRGAAPTSPLPRGRPHPAAAGHRGRLHAAAGRPAHGQGSRAAVQPFPHPGRQGGGCAARAGNALHRRGHGHRQALRHRLRQEPGSRKQRPAHGRQDLRLRGQPGQPCGHHGCQAPAGPRL